MYGAIRAYGIDGKSKVKPINRYSGAIFDADIVEIGRGKSTVIYLVRLLASRAIDAKGKLFLPNLRSTLDLIDFFGGLVRQFRTILKDGQRIYLLKIKK